MSGLRVPFWQEIEGTQTILLAGCGGGFDIFCGLPLYFAMREMGKTVHLANLSFSQVEYSTGERIIPGLMKVDASTRSRLPYFPELHLCHWLAEQNEPAPIYCFDRTGVLPLLAAYQAVLNRVKADTIVLIDGGTDSLMRGDEVGLGTPHEDIASIAAVSLLDVPRKLLVCLGFGVDTYHGVCHVQFLEAVAEITRAGGFLGAWTLTREMPEVQRYREASAYVFSQMPDHPSIVTSSILSAIEGQFGNYHATERTQGSPLFINALMSLYWAFQLDPVIQRIQYLEEMIWTQTHTDVHRVIATFRARLSETKPWQSLPM